MDRLHSIGLAKRFVWIFLEDITKTQTNVWPTQYLHVNLSLACGVPKAGHELQSSWDTHRRFIMV